MRYAEIAVDSRTLSKQTYSYSIPKDMVIEEGQLVWVPFGSNVVQGIVFRITNQPTVAETRDILQAIEPAPLVNRRSLQMANWLSQYYLCPLFTVLSLFLPNGLKQQVQRYIHLGKNCDLNYRAENMALNKEVIYALARAPIKESEFAKLLEPNSSNKIRRLINSSIVEREYRLPRGRSFKYSTYLVSKNDQTDTGQKLSERQHKLLEAVLHSPDPYPTSLANKEFGQGVANALVKKGLVAQEWTRIVSGKLDPTTLQDNSPEVILTTHQTIALNNISRSLANPNQSDVFLLHGVTGSGKTEVYLKAIQNIIEQGRQAIYLVPEIRLTPQTVSRVRARFRNRVAVIHSQLTPRQRFELWWEIRDGLYDVIIGPRSALFTPIANLGLVVIDEEHEWTYKQSDSQPYYDARTVAIEYGKINNAVVILGSATPSIESYHRAIAKSYSLLELPYRINKSISSKNPTIQDNDGMAETFICDMRKELKEGNRSIFSRELKKSLEHIAANGEQGILFINRRGNSPIVQCRDCGYVMRCTRCSIPFTFHSENRRLLCHRCGRRRNMVTQCPNCSSKRIRQLGIGTQRVVEELRVLLPGVTIDRWDSDSQQSDLSPEDPMNLLQSGETQILVGTQVVAKGLDLPNVTLVGAVLADIGLHIPDFRSSERTFSILCQLAGRAGRGFKKGKVIIQTYSPEALPIIAAAKQSYTIMFENEIQERRRQSNPPFSSLLHLVYKHTNPITAEENSNIMYKTLQGKIYASGHTDIEVIGPAPGFPSKVRGSYRWHILLRGHNLNDFIREIVFPSNWIVDVDPAEVI